MNDTTVYIVDDDRAVRDSLRWVLESSGYRVVSFDSAEAFLDAYAPAEIACLVLDVAMPGMSGLELQQQLNSHGTDLPIIFISAHGNVPVAVSAMRQGAVDFLMKPFDNHALLERVALALESGRQWRIERRQKAIVTKRLAGLTPREHEVLEAVVEGLTNKQIARKLLISVKTVETHRASIMAKTGAGSLAELVKLAMAGNST